MIRLSPNWHIHIGPLLKMIYKDTRQEMFGPNSPQLRTGIEEEFVPVWRGLWEFSLWNDETDEGRDITWHLYRKGKELRLWLSYHHIPAHWWEH